MSEWVRSSYATGDGFEARLVNDMIEVRHSAHPDIVHTFNETEWTAFLAAAYAGEFDL